METTYAIRFTSAARQAIDEHHAWVKASAGKGAADAWQDDILKAIGPLATLPHRCVVAKEDELFPEAVVRQLVYPRRRGPAAYRILFTVHEDPDDAPFVRVQFVLHTSHPPLTEWPADEDV